MKRISVEEYNKNPQLYIDLSKDEDVVVIKDGKVFLVLKNDERALEEFLKLKEELPKVDKNFDYNEAIGKEIIKRCH